MHEAPPLALGFRTVAVAAMLLVALVLTGCAGAPDEGVAPTTGTPQRGGTLVIGSPTDVDSWNEYLSRQARARSYVRRMYLQLAQELGDIREHPPSYEPQLAESWERGADGLSLTFRLRAVSWSDGRPLTADDVRFTWTAQISDEVAWVGRAVKRRILDVEVVDERTVTFHFDGDYPGQFGDAVSGGIIPRHVFGEVPFAGWANHDWSTLRVGSGPFLLEDHQRAHQIVMKANPAYMDPELPLLNKVVTRIVPSASSLVTQLRAGDIDFVEGVDPRQAAEMENQQTLRIVAFDWPSVAYIGWNGSRPPFDDPQVRRALTLAIDREALVEELLYGYGRRAVGPLPTYWWSAVRDLEPWPYDPARARKLLRERGWAVSEDAAAPATGGRTLSFELATNLGNEMREASLVKIQEQLSRIGVDVRVQPLEMRTLGGKIVGADYDAYVLGSLISLEDLESIFGSRWLPPDGGNYIHYASDEVDARLAELATISDWRQMKPVLDAIQRQIHEDLPYTYLYESQRIVAHGPALRGVEIDVPTDPLARLERFWLER